MSNPECPLEQADDTVLGLRDYVWEPGIPAECYGCFFDGREQVSEEIFDAAEDTDYEDADYYFCIGMKAVGPYARLAVEDTGIDDSWNNFGPLTTRTVYSFDCPNRNPLAPGQVSGCSTLDPSQES